MSEARQDVDRLAASAGERLGERMRSVTLFGSLARGEAVAGRSDVNVLCLVDSVDVGLLSTLGPIARLFAERNGAPPLIMDAPAWSRAQDSFAIEIADMLDARVVIVGDDPVAGMRPPAGALRLQAERELRVKLLHLREGLLVAAGHQDEVGGLLVRALPSLVTYLRTALRLAGRDVPPDMSGVIEQGCALTDTTPHALRHVLGVRQGGRDASPTSAAAHAEGIHESALRIVDYIDSHPEERVA